MHFEWPRQQKRGFTETRSDSQWWEKNHRWQTTKGTVKSGCQLNLLGPSSLPLVPPRLSSLCFHAVSRLVITLSVSCHPHPSFVSSQPFHPPPLTLPPPVPFLGPLRERVDIREGRGEEEEERGDVEKGSSSHSIAFPFLDSSTSSSPQHRGREETP